MELLKRPEVIAAIASALATLFAAIATWRGPSTAAKLAERLRRDAEKSAETRRLKLHVFGTIMQERAAYYSLEGTRSFNLIDIVFNDCKSVREAWAEMFLSLGQNIPEHVKEERLRKLLIAMADDLGLGNGLRTDDIGRVYFPQALADEELIRALERKNSLNRLQGTETAPSANTTTPTAQFASKFPPPPKAAPKEV